MSDQTSEVQSIMFDGRYFSKTKANNWLKHYGFEKVGSFHDSDDWLCARINSPAKYSHFITKPLAKDHDVIRFIIGFRK